MVVGINVTAHIENQGDVQANAPQQYVGTKGQNRKLEGFALTPSVHGVTLEYMAHIAGKGDSHWHQTGHYVGTRGENRAIEGFAVRLTGPSAHQYDVKYYAHVAHIGDTPIVSNGAYVGTRGESKAVQGFAVWLEPKHHGFAHQPAVPYPTASPFPPGYPPSASPYPPSFPPSYPPQGPHHHHAAPQPQVTVYLKDHGQFTAVGQQYAGTRGQCKPVQAFSVSLNYPGLDIEYTAHIGYVGDVHWHRNGQVIGQGHVGTEKDIQGFAVRLTGPASGQFDVKYTAHIQDLGDSHPHSNGDYCGTKGQSKRIEGITIWIEPKRY